jgi:hypothetical protein
MQGIFGSFDCMHVYWKKCPKTWNGSYKKKGSKSFGPFIIYGSMLPLAMPAA